MVVLAVKSMYDESIIVFTSVNKSSIVGTGSYASVSLSSSSVLEKEYTCGITGFRSISFFGSRLFSTRGTRDIFARVLVTYTVQTLTTKVWRRERNFGSWKLSRQMAHMSYLWMFSTTCDDDAVAMVMLLVYYDFED